jgi:hypothetical protein
MEHYAGIDVSLESASVCVMDASGRIVCEAKVASEPDVLIRRFGNLGVEVSRIGLEAGPLSQWLYAGMREAGLPVELLETRHVRDAFKAMPVKTDRKHARGIAQLIRLGWFRPVHCKSLPAQELRAVLTARKLVQGKRHDIEMSLRGILRGFGLKVGPTTTRGFDGRINRKFGQTDTKRPEQVPSPGRWIRSGRSAASGSYKNCAFLDWPADPHQTPSGGSSSLTPDRSKTPATGSRSKGIAFGIFGIRPLRKPFRKFSRCRSRRGRMGIF